jgi:hypothetical protein
MGLLDDAIREHLELKRLRGADPGYVAREEQAALGPIRREDEVEPGGSGEGDTEMAPANDSSFPDAEPASGRGSSSASQETIEINMEAELTAQGDPASEPAAESPGCATPAAHPAHTQTSSGESLEWEMPGDRRDKPTQGEGSQGDDPGTEGEHESAQPVEDVLEETPDFLRDTPEQERLWFEQRPPRDFDFNE